LTSTGLDTQPAWSPDGELIVFVRFFRDESDHIVQTDLFVIRPDGSGERRLTRNKHEEQRPDWQPKPR
jgi:TolB protein